MKKGTLGQDTKASQKLGEYLQNNGMTNSIKYSAFTTLEVQGLFCSEMRLIESDCLTHLHTDHLSTSGGEQSRMGQPGQYLQH